MGRSRKYKDDVAVSAPYTQLACQQGGVVPIERTYVDLTCNHCNHSWKMPEGSLGTNRASESLNHLRACKAFATTGKELPPPKAKKSKALAPATEAVEANTDATRENTGVLRQQLEVQKEMLALEKARGDRWKRDAKRSCEGTGVSSPSSSDSDGERAAKRARGNAHHEAKGKTYGIVEGRRVAYTVLGESLGCEAPEEPESVDEVGHRLEKRAVDLLGQELIAKNLYSHNTRLNRELNLPTHAMPAEQLGAVRKLEKVARVAQTVSKGRKGGDSGDATGDAIVEMVEAKNAKVQTAAKILVRELPDGEVKDRLMRKIPHSGNDYDDAWHASGSSHV
mgnify:CR=1 FL=1